MMKHILVALLLISTANAKGLRQSIAENAELVVTSVASWSQLIDDAKLYAEDDNGNPVLVNLNQSHTETAEEAQTSISERVFFYLYTRKTNRSSEILKVDDLATLHNSHIDLTKDTKFVTHGWLNTRKSQACTLIRDGRSIPPLRSCLLNFVNENMNSQRNPQSSAFLRHDDCNVIVIDWSAMSVKPYSYARYHVLPVGKEVAKMIDFLVSQGMNPKRITTVGHSFGAHIASLASYYAQKKVSYIVGLDPAFPMFLRSGPGERLSRGDGDYVEVIHTNGGMIGYPTPLGDADFFPNGGTIQNGCVTVPVGLCSHVRAYKYYAESINSDGFVAKKCVDYIAFRVNLCHRKTALMGGVRPKPAVRGSYYLSTNTKEPFARGNV